MARRCAVCGYETDKAICPRCNTVLLRGEAICPRCGKMFSGWIAACDACGAALGPRPRTPEDAEAVQLLASVPGISEPRARELAARGFRDFADVVKLALPESEVKKGLHHAIARRALLPELEPRTAARTNGRTCAVCGTPWRLGTDRCPTCGSARAEEIDAEVIERKLQEVTGEIVDLAQDEDFREMPAEIRDEILHAFAGVDEGDILREEYRRQIEAWRAKGFVVEALERLLESDPQTFRERGVRLIRAQILKKSRGGHYRCPLCDAALAATAEECENCGARFA